MPNVRPALVAAAFLASVQGFGGAPPSIAAERPTGAYVPQELSLMTRPQASELRELVERFVADRDEVFASTASTGSELQTRRMREFYAEWRRRLDAMAYESLGTEGRVDWLLLSRRLDYELRLLDRRESRAREMAPLIPFAGDLAGCRSPEGSWSPSTPRGRRPCSTG